MKKIIFLLLSITPSFLNAQQTSGMICPGNSFTNLSPDTLFYLPKQKLEILMDREEINKELIATLENRVEVCDSALLLKCREAENWHEKLLETDTQLMEAEIENVRKEHRHKVFCKIWFGTGVVLGWVVCIII